MGFLYFVPSSILSNNPTRAFSPSKFGNNNPYTIRNIKLWLILNRIQFELIGNQTYEDSTKVLQWKCLKDSCGEIFSMCWGNVTQYQNCPYCSGHQVGLSNCLATLRPDLAKEWHPTLNGNLTPWDVTYKCNDKVWWQCKDNSKHEWKINIDHRTGGSRCPYCAEYFPSEEHNLLVKNPKLCEDWDYDKNDKDPEEYTPSSRKKVWWKCKECSHSWFIQINNRNNGNGCPNCAESKGEKIISEVLGKYNINYNIQYVFDDLLSDLGNKLRFDTSVFKDEEKVNLQLLIEFDGQQHFEWIKSWMPEKSFKKLQYHDILKNQYCISHNIPLIRIPYWEIDNIELILTDILIHNNMDSKFIIKE